MTLETRCSLPTSLLLTALICFGCRNPDYSHDSPTARAEQEKSLEGFDNNIAGKPLNRYLGPRTGWILPADSVLLTGDGDAEFIDFGGRAAAITDDGYYLTAFHVVDGIQPMMVLPPTTQCDDGQKSALGGAKCILSKGRLVKHFEPHDFAIVKFGHRPTAFFEDVCCSIEERAAVFVAATDGYVLGDEKLGNGPYKARGQVISTSKSSGLTTVTTSIPVRGGMSGTPCSDSMGRLVGVLTGGRTSNIRHRTLTSKFVTVPLEVVLEAIEGDRLANID